MTDTTRHERPTPVAHSGEDARQARIRLARQLLESVGAAADIAEAGAGDAADDPHFLDDVVASLVDDGVVALARLPERRASEENLDRALLGPAFCSALDRRRGVPAGARERARLGRLYGLAGDVEKAASCYREVLDDRGPVPLSLVVELAQVAHKAGERALALGAVDRVAEVVLTGDPSQEKSPEDATVSGSALERASAIALAIGAAPRAAALARASVLIFERAGLKRESMRALGQLGRSLLATGDRPGARATFERWRTLASGQGELPEAAHALETAAAAFLDQSDTEAAADWLEQAADVRSASGDKRSAAKAALRAGELRVEHGDLAPAALAFERGRAYAATAKDTPLEAQVRIALARARVAEGQLGFALDEAKAALIEREGAGDRATAADANVALAAALLAAGDADAARAHVKASRDAATGAAAARALEVRAELAVVEGREDDAQALLADAGRLHSLEKREADAARTVVRRAELALAANDLARARGTWAPLAGIDVPELAARGALVEAALTEGEDDKRAALDRAFDLAFSKDYHSPRVAAAVTRSLARLESGKVELAASDARSALESIRDARRSLPEGRRPGFLAAPAQRSAVACGQKVREALARIRAERPKGDGGGDDETGGVESALNALDLLLGLLVPAPAP